MQLLVPFWEHFGTVHRLRRPLYSGRRNYRQSKTQFYKHAFPTIFRWKKCAHRGPEAAVEFKRLWTSSGCGAPLAVQLCGTQAAVGFKWLQAVDMIMRVMTEQQKSSEQQAREQPHELGPYNFGERARSTTRCTPAPPWHATARWKLTLICTLLAVHGVCRTQGARRRSPPIR